MAIVSPPSQTGGWADVYLDGKAAGELDAYVVERTHDNNLWHVYDLRPGEHVLRIVTRGDADARSRGRRVLIVWAVVYRRHDSRLGRRGEGVARP